MLVGVAVTQDQDPFGKMVIPVNANTNLMTFLIQAPNAQDQLSELAQPLWR